ncbi:dis3-like exonuclease 2 [Plakobranchus ocellatus]|uniref:DIS3-like exonuclease 2 n=1 Tax=Plakobranchus ocellatus TaxID=259542 RepID=A0AAV4AVA4_9GAST|nr:dis3-like exonuclease 2 [Plakobranchus ocellatus]
MKRTKEADDCSQIVDLPCAHDSLWVQIDDDISFKADKILGKSCSDEEGACSLDYQMSKDGDQQHEALVNEDMKDGNMSQKNSNRLSFSEVYVNDNNCADQIRVSFKENNLKNASGSALIDGLDLSKTDFHNQTPAQQSNSIALEILDEHDSEVVCADDVIRSQTCSRDGRLNAEHISSHAQGNSGNVVWDWLVVDSEVSLKFATSLSDCCKPVLLSETSYRCTPQKDLSKTCSCPGDKNVLNKTCDCPSRIISPEKGAHNCKYNLKESEDYVPMIGPSSTEEDAYGKLVSHKSKSKLLSENGYDSMERGCNNEKEIAITSVSAEDNDASKREMLCRNATISGTIMPLYIISSRIVSTSMTAKGGETDDKATNELLQLVVPASQDKYQETVVHTVPTDSFSACERVSEWLHEKDLPSNAQVFIAGVDSSTRGKSTDNIDSFCSLTCESCSDDIAYIPAIAKGVNDESISDIQLGTTEELISLVEKDGNASSLCLNEVAFDIKQECFEAECPEMETNSLELEPSCFASFEIKTEPLMSEEFESYMPLSEKISATNTCNTLLDCIKEEMEEVSSQCAYSKKVNHNSLILLENNSSEQVLEDITIDDIENYQGTAKVLCKVQDMPLFSKEVQCQDIDEEISYVTCDDDDDDEEDGVIIVETPSLEPLCITINDSYCSTAEPDTIGDAASKSRFSSASESWPQDWDPQETLSGSREVSRKELVLPFEAAIDKNSKMQQNKPPQESKAKDKRQRHRHRQSHSNSSAHSQSPGDHQMTRGQRQSQQQRSNQKIFEPYWPLEAVNDGIKRGELIVGPIRINPKNYEDAYIPLPDGKSDLFIGGMPDRNRALNSDVVVVQPYPQEKWRVFVEEFEFYEKSLCANDTVEEGRERSDQASVVDDGGGEESDDSGPDVIFDTDSENEADTSVSRKLQSEASNSKPTVAEGGADGGGGAEQQTLEQAVADLNIAAGSASKDDDKMMAKINKVVNRINNKKTPTTPPQKFSSVSEMAMSGSPLARDLFGAGFKPDGDERKLQLVQQTGKVVYIFERKHSRAASGRLKLMPDKNKNVALFSPSDSRVPRIQIPLSECPKNFYQRPQDHANTLFIARIQKWDEGMKVPLGSLSRSLGEAGQVEPETEAMLIEMDVDHSPFSEQVERCLPSDLPWSIPESEFAYRKDLRRCCIFTIDPATARDLDDAVSIEELGEGKYEVGVHIADVSYFVEENTALDEVAAQRATSVYLIQKVIPMLPRLLCEELCSLNPDHDRLAFSVCWVINENGEIFNEWYGRSVIRSCVKLSYEHAQGFIDEPDKDWSEDELPEITNSFGVEDVKKRVLQLNKIANSLRKQRFDNGALRLDQVKLQYSLNSDTGLPNGYSVYQQKESNRLIEEFMLLANMAVAHKIKSSFPDKAVLRRHPPPQIKPLMMVEDVCESLGLEVDAGSAGSLQNSLWKYYGDDEFSQARLQVLVVLVSKPMQNAKYFCAGTFPDQAQYHHYALNVPLYTHFTSPIRRYPDILVHRLLAASLDYSSPTESSTQLLQRLADHCNDKKFNAKMASESSSDMFFALFVKEAGPLEETGMVMGVLNKSFDVLILKLGVVKRVYLERLPLKSHKYRKNHKCPELEIEWVADEKCDHRTKHLISLFTMVECIVFADKEPLRWSCVIKRPKQEIKFISSED